MRRLALPLIVLLAAPVGCATDSHKPDAAWAMAVCKRNLKNDHLTTAGGPYPTPPITLLDARVVTADEAKHLKGGFVPTNGGETPKYAASCKIRVLNPNLGIRDGKGAAILAYEEGATTFVVDPHWAR
jgi:hypothetical protein